MSFKPPQEQPLFENNYMGFWIKVYSDRVELNSGLFGRQSIPINQIASVQSAPPLVMQVTIETTGGQKYNLPTMKKKKIQRAISDAQARFAQQTQPQPPPFQGYLQHPSVADELQKLAQLRDQGVITPVEFEAQKRRLLGG